MALAPKRLLAGIKAAFWATGAGCSGCLRVDHSCDRIALPPFVLACVLAQPVVHGAQRAVLAPARQLGVHGRPRWKVPARATFAGKVREMADGDPLVVALVEPLLAVLATMGEQFARLTKQVLAVVKCEVVYRQLMSTPGVGPITALAFRATVDRPDRFHRSRDVGAHLGLTPSRYQSGETDIQGRVSRCGDELAHTALYEAAHSLLVRSRKWSTLRAWGMGIAKRRCMARARGAVARKLAVILHRMWSEGTEFRFGREPGTALPTALTKKKDANTNRPERANRIVPARTRGKAISLRTPKLQAYKPARS